MSFSKLSRSPVSLRDLQNARALTRLAPRSFSHPKPVTTVFTVQLWAATRGPAVLIDCGRLHREISFALDARNHAPTSRRTHVPHAHHVPRAPTSRIHGPCPLCLACAAAAVPPALAFCVRCAALRSRLSEVPRALARRRANERIRYRARDIIIQYPPASSRPHSTYSISAFTFFPVILLYSTRHASLS